MAARAAVLTGTGQLQLFLALSNVSLALVNVLVAVSLEKLAFVEQRLSGVDVLPALRKLGVGLAHQLLALGDLAFSDQLLGLVKILESGRDLGLPLVDQSVALLDVLVAQSLLLPTRGQFFAALLEVFAAGLAKSIAAG
jgi:hypothetical protein